MGSVIRWALVFSLYLSLSLSLWDFHIKCHLSVYFLFISRHGSLASLSHSNLWRVCCYYFSSCRAQRYGLRLSFWWAEHTYLLFNALSCVPSSFCALCIYDFMNLNAMIKWRDNNDINDLLEQNYTVECVLSCMQRQCRQRQGFFSLRMSNARRDQKFNTQNNANHQGTKRHRRCQVNYIICLLQIQARFLSSRLHHIHALSISFSVGSSAPTNSNVFRPFGSRACRQTGRCLFVPSDNLSVSLFSSAWFYYIQNAIALDCRLAASLNASTLMLNYS